MFYKLKTDVSFLRVIVTLLSLRPFESILANLMYGARKRTAPSNIQDVFQDISNVHSYNTRCSASNNFYTKHSRLSV